LINGRTAPKLDGSAGIRRPITSKEKIVSRRIAIIGSAALFALALSAISASGASAGATAFLCWPGEGGKNTNSDCEPGSTGISGHVAITPKSITALSYLGLAVPTLTGKLFGATIQISVPVGESCVGCTGENKEVGGVMEFAGTGKIQFTMPRVVGAETKCTVPPITTKPLKFTTTSVAGVTLEPATGTLLAEFEITGAECPFAAEHIKVTGKAFGAANGAKLTFNVTKASEELKLEGEKAALTGIATVSALTPIALTTTTP
jgi:hypothetical protein